MSLLSEVLTSKHLLILVIATYSNYSVTVTNRPHALILVFMFYGVLGGWIPKCKNYSYVCGLVSFP